MAAACVTTWHSHDSMRRKTAAGMDLACRFAMEGGLRGLQPTTGTGYSPRPVGALPMRAEGALFKPSLAAAKAWKV